MTPQGTEQSSNNMHRNLYRRRRNPFNLRQSRFESLEDRRPLAADLEPNNSLAQATDLGTGTQFHLDPTISAPGDQDYFKWTASTHGTLRADLIFQQNQIDLVLEILNSVGTRLVQADTITDNERASVPVSPGQVFYIHAFEFFGTGLGGYDLGITEITMDSFDQSASNGTMATATNLGTGDQTHNNLSIHSPTDIDYYRWTPTVSGQVEIDVNFSHFAGDLDLEVVDAGGAIIAASTSVDDNENVMLNVTAGQPIFIRVFEEDGLEHPNYSMNLDFHANPTITDYAVINGNRTIPTVINFTLGDADSPLDSLILTARSSQQSVVSDGNLKWSGTGANRQLTVIPTSLGFTSITIMVNDADGGIAEETFEFRTFLTAVGPTISSINDQTVAEDGTTAAIFFTVTDDSPIASLTFSATSSNPTLIPVSNIVLTPGTPSTVVITPAPNQNGTAEIVITITDPAGNIASEAFNVTVTPVADAGVNDPPFFNFITDRNVFEDSVGNTVTITGLVPGGSGDESGQTVTLSAVSSDPFLIPNPISVSGSVLTFSTYPNRTGTAEITVTATDNGGTAGGGVNTFQQKFKVTVSNVNDAPTMSPLGNITVQEGTPSPVLNLMIQDLETPPSYLTLTATSSNQAVVPNSNITVGGSGPNRTLSLVPVGDGQSTITVTLSDGVASTVQTFTIQASTVNDPPSFTPGGPQNVLEDAGTQAVSWATNISAGPNESGQSVNFLITGNSNPGLFAVAPQISPSGILSYTLAPNTSGTANITLVLKDSGGTANGGQDTSAPANLTITVDAVNDPPTFTKGADISLLEDAGPQSIATWATGISAGPGEGSQTVLFNVTNNTNASLFSVAPAVSSNGTLTFTPAPDASGTATITLVAKDDGSLANGGQNTSAPQTFTINITSVNDAPSFVPGSNPSVIEDSGPVVVPGWATNIKPGNNETGQNVAFSVTGNSNPALFATAPTVAPDGTLTFTPASSGSGTATITLVLTDDGGTANGGVNASAPINFTITVGSVNDPPSFTKGSDLTLLEDAGAQSIAGWATNISAGLGESSQTLAFNVTGNTNSSMFAVAPAVSPNGTLTFTPAANAHGSATITLVLTDNGGTANGGSDTSAPQTFTIAITPVNDAPSFTKGPNPTVIEDAGAQTIASWATNISANDSGQTLTFNVTGNTNASLFSVAPAVSPNGTLTFTPAPGANGSADITLVLVDNGGTANGGIDASTPQTFTINVSSVNNAPSFTKGTNSTVLEDAGPQSIASWATAINANDPGQSVTFNVTGNTNPALFSVAPLVGPNGTLTFTPAPGASGAADITLVLVDNGGTANGGIDTSAPQTFTITVTPVNDAPSFTKGPNPTVAEDAGAQTIAAWATNINANDSGQSVTFNVSGNSNTALFSVLPSVTPNGTLTFTPAPNVSGVATITLVLVDDGGTSNGGVNSSASTTFDILVSSVNDAPVFTKGIDQALLESAGPQTVANWASGISAGPADEGGQTVSFNITGNTNPGLFAVAPSISPNGTLSYTPNPNVSGIASITLVLVDSGGTANGGSDTSAAQTFVVNVASVNAAPSFTKGGDQTVLEDSGAQTVPNWATNISAGPGDVAQTVSFQVTENSNPALFAAAPAISANGQLIYTPAANANGSATITLVAKDDGGTANGGADTSAPQTFTITVTPVNDGPSFVKGTNPTVLEDVGAQSIAGWATAINANDSGQTVNFSVTGNTNGALFAVAPAVSPNGTLTFTPAANFSGSADITLVLVDDGGVANGGINTSVAQTFTITVTPVNDVPSFSKGANITLAEDAGPQSIVGWATAINAGVGEGTQTVQFGVTNNTNPSLFSAAPLVASDGTLTFTPAPNAHGTATVSVALKDNGGTTNGGVDTSAIQTFEILLTPVNDQPTIGNINDLSMSSGGTQSVSISVADIDNAALTVSATSSNQAVLTNSSLAITGSGNSFTLALNPVGLGSATISVVVSDGTATATETFVVTVSDNTAPVVNRIIRNGGSDRFDTFTSIGAEFSKNVESSISVDDLVILNSAGNPISTAGVGVSWTAATRTATWNLSSLSLPVGRYTIRLQGNGIVDANGIALDGDGNGTPGGNFETTTVVTWAGDTDRDLDVDFVDFLALSLNFGQAGGWSQGNFNGDQLVAFDDFLALSANFGKVLPPPAPAPSADTMYNALLPADVSGDGRVTTEDAELAVDWIINGPNEARFPDVDNNGVVSVLDVVVIARVLSADEDPFAEGEGDSWWLDGLDS